MAVYLGKIAVSSGASAGAGALVQVASLPATGDNDKLYLLIADFGGYSAGLYYYNGAWIPVSTGGGSGTDDYNVLLNKPRINGVELRGNKTNADLNIADRDNTYTKIQVDQIVAAAQKIYVKQTMPDPLNDRVGLYYYDVMGDGSSYQLYIIDSNKTITSLGDASISLDGYQTTTDMALETTDKTVPGAINELKQELDSLDVSGNLEFNGLRGIEVTPTYSDDGATVESYTIAHRNSGMSNTETQQDLQQLNFGDVIENDTFSHDAQGHKTEKITQQYQLPIIEAGDNIEIEDDGMGTYTIKSLSKGIVEVDSLPDPAAAQQDVLYKWEDGVYWYNGTEYINIASPDQNFIIDVIQLPDNDIDENMLYRIRETTPFNDMGIYTYLEGQWYSIIGGGGTDLPVWDDQLLIDIFSNNSGIFVNTILRDNTVAAASTWSSSKINGYLNNNYYTKGQVDANIASAQKVYVQATVPTSSSNAGLYYVGTTSPYDTYVVDSLGVVSNIGTTDVDLTDYQKKEDQNLNTVSKEVVGAINELIGNQLMPVGMIAPFGGTVAPDGWLLCDGSEYDIFVGGQPTLYYALYDVIKQSYGGTGTTFKVPDLRGRFLEGASSTSGHEIGNKVAAGLPDPSLTTNSTGSHNHTITDPGHTHSYSKWNQERGSYYSGNYWVDGNVSATTGKSTTGISLASSGSHSHTITVGNSIYGNSTTVQPASVCVNYIIKY